jgi:putative transposase
MCSRTDGRCPCGCRTLRAVFREGCVLAAPRGCASAIHETPAQRTRLRSGWMERSRIIRARAQQSRPVLRSWRPALRHHQRLQRKPLLATPKARDCVLEVFERVRRRYEFEVVGYVIMPEHMHLLIGEPRRANPSVVLQASSKGPEAFCSSPETRCGSPFYDTDGKITEKLDYMQMNPVRRGLVLPPSFGPGAATAPGSSGNGARCGSKEWSSRSH